MKMDQGLHEQKETISQVGVSVSVSLPSTLWFDCD
jgi:hypothetical protein